MTDSPSSEAHRSLPAPVSCGVSEHHRTTFYCRWWHTRLSPAELDTPLGERDPAHLFTPMVCSLRPARPAEKASGPSWLNGSLVLEPRCGPFPYPFLSLTLPSLLSIRGRAWTLKSPEWGPCCRKFFGETLLFSHSPCGFWPHVDYFKNLYLFIYVAALSLSGMWDL